MKTEAEYTEFVRELINQQDPVKMATEDFNPTFTFHVDIDQPRLVFFPQITGDEQERNKIAWALTILSSSMDNLWAVVFVVDTYHATVQTKHDGSNWGYGDMQRAFLGKTVDADLVYEALTYQVTEVDGCMAMVSLPYTRHNDHLEYHWDKVMVGIEGESGAQFQGFYPDAMRHALKAPKMMETMREAGVDYEQLGLDLESARIHSMSIAAKMVLHQIQMPVLIPTYSEEEDEILRHSLKNGPFSEGINSYNQNDIEEITTLQEQFDAPTAVPIRPWSKGD